MQFPLLKLRLQQETAVFRNPLTTEIIETYPLPPPSTIIGFFLSLLRYSEPRQIISNVSIQGTHESMIRDYVWFRRFSEAENRFEKQQKPILIHTLLNLQLVLHIQFFDSAIVEHVRNSLMNHGFLYLGRAEDLVKIDEIKWFEAHDLHEQELDTGRAMSYDAFVPNKDVEDLRANGIPYRLSTNYTLQEVSLRKRELTIRECQWIDALFLEKGTIIEPSKPLQQDSDGDYIWWCMQNQDLLRV